MFLVRESVVLEDTAKDVNRIKQKHREAINEAKLMFREAKQCLRDKKKAEGLKKINTAITTFKTVIRETDKVRIEGEDKLFTTYRSSVYSILGTCWCCYSHDFDWRIQHHKIPILVL